MIDRSRSGWLFWFGFGLSLAVHLGIAAWLIDRQLQRPGAVELPVVAISVNLETTDILQATEQSAAKEAAAAPQAQPAASEDKAEPKPVLPEPETMPTESIPAQPPAEPQLPKPDDLALERERKAKEEEREQEKARQITERRERLKREEEAREAEKRRRLEAEKQARERSRRTTQSLGASGSRSAQSSQGRVSASQGNIRNYAAMVRARIAQHKPQGGATGRAIVAFAISPSGAVSSARLVHSSGNAALDRSALAAVHSASPFPPPPPGIPAGQLRFTIPFDFR